VECGVEGLSESGEEWGASESRWRGVRSGSGEEREIPLGADGVECGVRMERRELPLRAVALSAEWRGIPQGRMAWSAEWRERSESGELWGASEVRAEGMVYGEACEVGEVMALSGSVWMCGRSGWLAPLNSFGSN